jgi:hypothetical protein
MASPAQTAFVNTVPLPSITNDPDPNGFMAPGPALIALDPNDPAAVQQPVGNAMDAMDGQEEDPVDAVTAQLAAGKRVRITTQTQWNAMSPHEKEVVRAAMATGGQLRSGDAVRIYQESVKRARATQVQTVTTSDGRKVDMINNQIIPAAKEPEQVKREIRETADGLRAIDPLTGESFQVYDKYSGSAVTGKPKISEDNRVQFNQAHIELQRIQSELNQVNAIPTNKKVTQDDNGMWVPSEKWFGGGEDPAKVKAKLLTQANYQSEKIRKIDPTNSVSAASASQTAPAATPSPTPSATPSPSPTPAPTRSAAPQATPNPMPTPDKFAVGKPYKDAKGNVKTYRGNGVWE